MGMGFKNNASNQIISYTDSGASDIKQTTLNTGGNIDISKIVPESKETDIVVDLDSMATSNSAKVDYGSGPSSDVSTIQSPEYAKSNLDSFLLNKAETNTNANTSDKNMVSKEQQMNTDNSNQTSTSMNTNINSDFSSNGYNGGSSNASSATPTVLGMAPTSVGGGGVGPVATGSSSGGSGFTGSSLDASYALPDFGGGSATIGVGNNNSLGFLKNVIYDTTKMTLTPDGTLRFEGVDFTQLSDDQLIGSMNQEEYDKFIGGVEEYYQRQIDYFESVLYGDNNDGLVAQLEAVNSVVVNVNSSANANIKYGSQDNPETLAGTVFKSQLDDVGVSSYEELKDLQQQLLTNVNYLNEAEKTAKNLKDSAKYDYLKYLDKYADYEFRNFTQEELDSLEKDADYFNPEDNFATNVLATATATGMRLVSATSLGASALLKDDSPQTDPKVPSYSYTKYHEKHPDVSPAIFMQMLNEKDPTGNYKVLGIDNLEDLRTMAEASSKVPGIAKTYSYLFEEDPKKAEQYLKDCKYEINNIKGQLEAKKFLDSLAEKDEKGDEIWELICNELDIHGKGVSDGVENFVAGFYHLGEAGFTGLQHLTANSGLYKGDIYENRTLDVSQYKKMYILQALMSQEDKQKMNLIDSNGNLVNSNSIVDFSKEYTGDFLKNNYEISQGIGNAIPSMALTTVNPVLASATMGASVGGNAYHGAMIEGNNYLSSLGYGVFSGTKGVIADKLLMGLPGFGEIQIDGLKTYIQSMIKAGNKGMAQGVMDAAIQCAFMGEQVPTTPNEWGEFALDIGKQGLYGAVTAGYMQVPKVASSKYNINMYNDYMKANNISTADQATAINAIKSSNPELANMTNEQIVLNHGQQVAAQVDLLRVQRNFNCDAKTAFAIMKNNVS